MSPRVSKLLTTCIAALLLASAVTLAAGKTQAKATEAKTPVEKVADAGTRSTALPPGAKTPGEAKLGDKTVCPVSDDVFTVDADSPKIEYAGKTYYVCCDDCVEDFKANPEKYLSRFRAK